MNVDEALEMAETWTALPAALVSSLIALARAHESGMRS